MEVEEVPKYMNKRVRYINKHNCLDNEYIFTAYILRKIGKNIFRQAELQDLHSHSIVIAPLEDILTYD